MHIHPISCPYCNALLAEIDPRTAGRRITCPRCGETFPSSPSPLGGEGWGEGAVTAPSPHPYPLSPKGPGGDSNRWSNRTIAFLILAAMGTVAILFLGFALQTEHIRREHDLMLPKAQSVTIPIGIAIVCNVYIVALIFAVVRPKERPGALPMTILLSGLTAIIVTTGLMRVHLRRSSNPYPEELSPYPPVISLAPAQLPGLAYLPFDTNVIAAIHVADLLQSEAGRNLLNQPGSQWNIAQLEQLTGLPVQETEHVILGLKVDDRLPPRLILVVQTLRPFSKTQLKEKLKTGRFPDPDAIRFPSGRTFVVGLTPKDLEAIPNKPPSGIGHLPAPIQTVLRERIDKSARVWVIGASDDWEKTVVSGYLTALSKETKDVVKKVQIFAVSMRLDHETTLAVALKCSDEKAAQALESFVKNQKMEAIKELKINQNDAWLTLQGQTSTEQIRQVLSQTIGVRKK